METWNGFKSERFVFEGKNCVIVFPGESNKTKNWCLKTEYWDAFPNMEIEMLKRGWHLAYIENKTHWCLDEDLDIKARFCDYLSKKYNLASKCVPVGMSCGGMFGVKFAAKYPEKVSVLYIDAPVINLLSCPGDLGLANGGMWEEFVSATGMSMSDLICYREHPLDMIPKLSENNIPIVMVYGDADDIVPYCENGALLEKYYKSHGKDLLAIRKSGCGHHPHGLDDPTPIINFILSHM